MMNEDDLPKGSFGVNGTLLEQDPLQFAAAQRNDKLLRKVLTARITGQSVLNKSQHKQLEPFARNLEKLQVNEAGIRMWTPGGSNTSLPIISTKLRQRLVISCHEMVYTPVVPGPTIC
ncbi:unnamed protein product [Dicrocoelium dendriticum]|nr:unnamed protein product [Dicrocoelium dendriticum]